MPAQTRGLSARETALLSSWERERRSRITLRDLQKIVGSNAGRVAERMAQKGALERIGRGIYAVRPFRALTRRSSSSAPTMMRSERRSTSRFRRPKISPFRIPV
jgi:predicted transcriptional regulator of viral defense system